MPDPENKTVRTIPVLSGNIFKILAALSDHFTESGPDLTPNQQATIMEALTKPDQGLLEVTIDSGTAVVALHPDLVALLSDNGFSEVL